MNQKGFTRAEIIILLVFVIVMFLLGFRSYAKSTTISRDLQRKMDIRLIQDRLEDYFVENGEYPQGSHRDLGRDLDGCNDPVEKALQCPQNEDPYLKDIPNDPSLAAHLGYFYYASQDNQTYFLASRLENKNDEDGTGIHGFPQNWNLDRDGTFYVRSELRRVK